MAIEISGPQIPGLPHDELRARLLQVLRAEGCPEEFDLSILLTGDEEIARLHERWMGLAGPKGKRTK